MSNCRIPKPSFIPSSIPKKTPQSSGGPSSLTRRSPRGALSSENKPTTSRLMRQPTAIIGSTSKQVLKRDFLRRSKSFSVLRAPLKQPVATFRKPIVPTKRPAPVATPTSVTGPPAKQAKVKIAAYDYKARFNDLLEKHRSLKEKTSDLEQRYSALQHTCTSLEQRCSALDRSHTESERLNKEKDLQLQDKKNIIQSLDKDLKDMQHKYLSENQKRIEIDQKYGECNAIKIQVQNENVELHTRLSKAASEISFMSSTIDDLNGKLNTLQKENVTYLETLQTAYDQRKAMHNTILDLKGNIRVFCRVRPVLHAEKDLETCVLNYPDECNLELCKTNRPKSPLSSCGSTKNVKHDFAFDQVFPPNATQAEVFSNVEALVQSALDGYNVCVFAYGQTGSGKTFTMEGVDDNLGIIPRTVDYLFFQMATLEPFGWTFTVTASFLEIYNEQIRDLLNSSNKEIDHEIKLVDGKNKDVYVSNLQEVKIKRANELNKLLRQAQNNRITAQTHSNERSSRSHSVAKIVICSTQKSGEIFKGTLNLVDLAGSESPKTSVRMDETKNINKSLAQLGKVILSLQQKQEHIPYRSSKLTFLLMPSLGGSSKTLMFVNVNPLLSNYSESVNALRFASQVNQVKTQKAKKNKTLKVK